VHSNCLSTPLLLVLHACTFLYFAATVVVDVVIGRQLLIVRGPSAARQSRLLKHAQLRHHCFKLLCVPITAVSCMISTSMTMERHAFVFLPCSRQVEIIVVVVVVVVGP
jgi:hypothetical protein